MSGEVRASTSMGQGRDGASLPDTVHTLQQETLQTCKFTVFSYFLQHIHTHYKSFYTLTQVCRRSHFCAVLGIA